MLKVKGRIVKRRPYMDWEEVESDCLAVMEMDEGTIVNGDKLKIISLLSGDSMIPEGDGEPVEVIGEIEFKRIITPTGERNFSPIPVLKPKQIVQCS